MVRNKNKLRFYFIILFISIFMLILINMKEIQSIKLNIKRQIKLIKTINQFDYNYYDVIQVGNQSRFNSITIMTSMFRFHKSKHPIEDYIKWSSTMFNSIGSPLVAYVDQYWSQRVIKLCQKRNLTALIFVFKSIWNIMSDLEENRRKYYIENYILNQIIYDPEKNFIILRFMLFGISNYIFLIKQLILILLNRIISYIQIVEHGAHKCFRIGLILHSQTKLVNVYVIGS